MRLKGAAEVFLPDGYVVSITLPIPNLVWFAQSFKRTLDAFEERVEINSCKYDSLIATHLNRII